MIVALYGKRVHAWLMSLSKFQAGILYFLMTAIPVIAVYLIAGVLFYHNYEGAFKDAGFLLVMLSMDAIYGAIFFKEKAFKKSKKEQELSTGESPSGNISDSEFIAHWGKKRKAGILKYVIANGLFAAFVLIFPVSFYYFPMHNQQSTLSRI
ncbi:hypothetical protein [Mucilaginibacter sp. AK015]|uniref:hypothetical protein n=1 Tax=Mucilaginibacter sp. AK015 TaxID=2723072 RepID=UPI00160AB8E2|nr:hypothetical protein [Mucilaginibacter sp. AK015]MBB5395425.1 hypothetical protein [Mucilaginibacter sp. AK015]